LPLLLLVLALGSALVALGIGPVAIPASRVVSLLFARETTPEARILQELRVPRVLAGLAVGGGLGLAGAVMQGVFRNPLADPYLMGVANGAAAGVVATLAFGISFRAARPVAAFLGGVLAVFLCWRLGRRRRELGLILAGIALAAGFSALTGFLLLALAGTRRVEEFLFWSMGSLARVSWPELRILGPTVLAALGVLLLWARDLNALALGEEGALHLGVDPHRARRLLLALSTVLASSTVAFCGVVAFVGLVVPHMVRLLVGPDHRLVLPGAALLGGTLLVWADAAARTLRAPWELPLGTVTALLGAPFFLYLLWARLGKGP
ncbi:MAG: FecCD family ABC transporter permease, partial [Candidatus Bipolaricaulaceae bacterium]